MDVDLIPLSKGVNQLNALAKYSAKPSKDEFTTYLDESNREAYDTLNEAVILLNKLDGLGYVKNKVGVMNSFAGRIGIDYNTTKFKFIK